MAVSLEQRFARLDEADKQAKSYWTAGKGISGDSLRAWFFTDAMSLLRDYRAEIERLRGELAERNARLEKIFDAFPEARAGFDNRRAK